MLEVTPGFSVAQELESHLAGWLFLVLWGTFFFGGLAHLALGGGAPDVRAAQAAQAAMGVPRPAVAPPAWLPFALVALVLLPLVPGLGLALARRSLDRSRFLFFPQRLEIRSGRRRRSVALAHVRAVDVEATPRQVRRREGTLRIHLDPGTGGRNLPPIRIAGVTNAERVARRIRELLESPHEPKPRGSEAA